LVQMIFLFRGPVFQPLIFRGVSWNFETKNSGCTPGFCIVHHFYITNCLLHAVGKAPHKKWRNLLGEDFWGYNTNKNDRKQR